MRRPRSVPAAVVVLCAVAGLWSAADVRAAVVTSTATFTPGKTENIPKFGPQYRPPTTSYEVTIVGGPGEANVVAVELAADAIVVRDVVALTPGAGCAVLDGTSVRCATTLPSAVMSVSRALAVSLGDGDDRFESPPGTPGSLVRRVDGGPGNDRITAPVAIGGPGDDMLTADDADGGEGNDVLASLGSAFKITLRGGPGADVLAGGLPAPLGFVIDAGEGADRILPGAGDAEILPGPGADVIDGGGGFDVVSFAYATAPVRADLAASGPIDPTGEGDAMTGAESVIGGQGDDVLLGGEGDGLLSGGAGADRLEGRGGRDVIIGGSGADTIAGGAGRDDWPPARATWSTSSAATTSATSPTARPTASTAEAVRTSCGWAPATAPMRAPAATRWSPRDGRVACAAAPGTGTCSTACACRPTATACACSPRRR